MMARTQISLDPEQHRQAQKRAAQLGVSLAEYLRRLLASDLGRPRTRRDASGVFALGSSGGADIARDKDRLVGDAVAARRDIRRPRR
jgi:hypothetical protein